MELKLLELRDRATFIPCFAFRARPSDYPTFSNRAERIESGVQRESERYLLSRAGYGPNGDSDCVILGRLECPDTQRSCTYDPFSWGGGARTFQVAHEWITAHWDDIKSGDVIDVEFILGETTTPKKSEQLF